LLFCEFQPLWQLIVLTEIKHEQMISFIQQPVAGLL